MKVILLQDVAKIGKRFDEVSVPDGYAQNQLVPKCMAMPATPENKKKISGLRAGKQATVASRHEAFTSALAALREKPLTIAMEANEQKHLFKAVHSKDIVAAAQVVGVTLEESMVAFSEPIKSLGEHIVTLQNSGQSYEVTVSIVAK